MNLICFWSEVPPCELAAFCSGEEAEPFADGVGAGLMQRNNLSWALLERWFIRNRGGVVVGTVCCM